MNDIEYTNRQIDIPHNPLSTSTRPRRSQRKRVSPSLEPRSLTTIVDSKSQSTAVDQAIMINNQLLTPNIVAQQKLGLSDSLNNASSDTDAPSSNFSYKKNHSTSDLDPFERRKQAALLKAEAKLEKAKRLHQIAQQNVDRMVDELLRQTTIPGGSHDSKTSKDSFDKCVSKLEDTKKQLAKKISDYQSDIARIRAGDIPKRYVPHDILSSLKSKVSNDNIEHHSTNETSTPIANEHSNSTQHLDTDNQTLLPLSSISHNTLTANNLTNQNQNLLSLSQNSNTLEPFRSSPSSSISNEIGNSQFYIDFNPESHDTEKSPFTRRRYTDNSNAESNDRISDHSSDERFVSQNSSKRNTMSTIEYHQLLLKIDLMQKTVDRYENRMTELQKQIDSLIDLNENQRQQNEHLSNEITDLTTLHQHEMPTVKNDLKKLEEKLLYNFNEYWSEMVEKLDKLETRTTKVEQTQAHSLETEENTHRLISKFVNILLTVFAIILLLLSTIKNLVQSRVHAVILFILVSIWITCHYLPENYFQRSYFRELPNIFKRTSFSNQTVMVSSLLARCIIVTIGTLYPGYRSYKSLITSDLRAVVDCLRYWIVFSIFIACETVTDIVLSWFPFYYWIKIAIVFWIVSPAGSTFLYKRFIQPLLKEREQEIDQLIEHTRQKSYSAILDLTNKGFRYASNVFLNTAVLGQTYLGEHLKRSLSTSDISNSGAKNVNNPPATLYEESEEDVEFTSRLKEDQKYLSKGTTRKPLSHYQEKPDDFSDNPLDEYEMSKVMSRRGRSANKTNSSENHVETTSKRQVKSTNTTKRSAVAKTGASLERAVNSSNDTDDEVENMRKRT
ncbi:unnamed protein product [Adineta ricciae]|uniref:Uncharacterized protein n=1 Tax=Adineta ricciae TaxID=249248 RepID=A0A813QGR5_ADIRI|nr:unnamed protein product [Adineta ricciae]